MQFTVESWEPGYGSSVGDGARDIGNDPSTRPVDAAMELEPDRWEPVDPTPAGLDPSATEVVFVDGVRRIDARIWIAEQAQDRSGSAMSRPGVCASVAAGAVRCRPGRAEVTDVAVRRGLYTASEYGTALNLSGPGAAVGRGTYDLRSVADDSDEAMYFGVHQHMTELEHELSQTVGGDEELVVYDGPLAECTDNPAAIGYIKTQHVQYLPPTLHGLIGRLAVGQRTPLFTIGGRFPVVSWYLRLPTRPAHAMSGIVRLELTTAGSSTPNGVEGVKRRADHVSLVLPRYASEAHKDGRAPQNLYPIAGLERHLRHLLGDSRVLERALRAATTTSAGVAP